jgi:hypothetical protein
MTAAPQPPSTPDTLDAAMRQTFGMLAASYGRRWDIPAAAAPAWAAAFESELVTERELLAAAAAWSATRPWPPSRAELRGAIPRLCTCGACTACHSRAVARAKRAAERGSLGAGSYDPPSVADVAQQMLAQHGAKSLPPVHRPGLHP